MYLNTKIITVIALGLWVTASVVNAQNSNCSYNLVGDSDDVFIMDRSRSLSFNHFARMKEFIADIIHYFFKLGQNKNRIAVILYNDHVTTPLNFISGDTPVSECELFLATGRWEKDVFFNRTAQGSPGGQLFREAFDKAKTILTQSDRRDSGIKQRIWIFSDLEAGTTLPASNNDPRLPDVVIHGFGTGQYLNMTNFNFMVTEPKECNGMTEAQWNTWLTDAAENQVASKTDGGYVPIKNETLCTPECHDGCVCLEYNQDDTIKCSEKPGDENKSTEKRQENFLDNYLYWIIIGVAGGLILLSVIIIACACVTRRRRRRKEEKKLKRFTEPINGMPEPSPFTVSIPTSPTPPNHPDVVPVYRPQPVDEEDLYMNGTFQKDLLAHGVELKSSDKKSNQTSQSSHPSIGKLYIKNQTSVQANGSSRFNHLPVPKLGHNRQKSDVSIASSAPSYIAPIPDSEHGGESRPGSTLDYSEPYMDIPSDIHHQIFNTTGRDGQGHHYYDRHIDHSSPNSHKYEQCTFPLAKKDKVQRTKEQAESAASSTELLDKLSKQKVLLRPISKQLSFKSQSAKETSEGKDTDKAKQSPKKLKIESSGQDYINIREPSDNIENKKDDTKRSSKKLGTGKFNAIKAQLEQGKKDNQNQLDIKNFAKVL